MIKRVCSGFVLLCLLDSCYVNRALIHPFSYAPPSQDKPWTPPKFEQKKRATYCAVIPDQKEPLSLAELCDIALQNNTATWQTWAEARASAASYAQTQSTALPTIAGTYGFTRSRFGSFSTTNGVDNVSTFYNSNWGPQLTLAYTIWDFGQERATSEAARYTLYFADWTHNRAIQTLIQTIANDYYSYLLQKHLLEAFADDVKTAQLTLSAAQAELDAGVISISDVLQAQTSLLQAQTKWVAQQQNVQNSYAQLLNDMGLPANQNFAVQGLPTVNPTEALIENIDKVIAIAMEERPDLHAAMAQLTSAEENIKAARAAYYPTLAYNAAAGKTYYPSGLNDNFDFNSTISFSIPIFTGYFLRNSVREAQANKEVAEAQLKSLQNAIIQQITTFHYNVKNSYETLKYAKGYLEAADDQYTVSLALYKQGTDTIIDVINAQNQLSTSRASLATALQQWFTSLVNLAYSTGVLSESSLPQPSSNITQSSSSVIIDPLLEKTLEIPSIYDHSQFQRELIP
jgi:outer membrane protein